MKRLIVVAGLVFLSTCQAPPPEMTDAEIAQINQRLSSLPAGSSSVVGAILIVFIVFVITDVLGATDIFPFIRPIR